MTNVQTWLESQEIYNTKEKREKVKEITIHKMRLEGELDLTEFTELKSLTISNNKLTEVVLNKCSNLMFLDCAYNHLTKLDLSNNLKLRKIEVENNKLSEVGFSLPTNKENLEQIDIRENNFFKSLEIFEECTNLTWLDISNNLFFGSLKPLQNLNKLIHLSIVDTNIDSGLEYLPANIKKFCCYVSDKPEAKVKNLREELETFSSKKNKTLDSGDLSKWRIRKYEELKKVREVQKKSEEAKEALKQTEEQIKQLIKQITQGQQTQIKIPPK